MSIFIRNRNCRTLLLNLFIAHGTICIAQPDSEGVYHNWNVPIHKSWVEMSSPEIKDDWNSHHFRNLHGSVRSIEQTLFVVSQSPQGLSEKRIKAIQPYVSTSGRTEFNRSGKRIIWEKDNGPEQDREKRSWTYDECGLLIEQGESKFRGAVIFTYDSLGRMIEKFEYSNWHDYDFRNTYVNADNYIAEERAYKVPGGLTYIVTISKDSTLLYTKHDQSGLREYRTDSLGNVVWEYRHSDLCTRVRTYDSLSRVISDSTFNSNGILQAGVHQVFDAKQRLILQHSFNISSPAIKRKKEYARNAIGDVVKMNTYEFSDEENKYVPNLTEDFSYIYDDKANWVEKKVYKNNELKFKVRRVIEYY